MSTERIHSFNITPFYSDERKKNEFFNLEFFLTPVRRRKKRKEQLLGNSNNNIPHICVVFKQDESNKKKKQASGHLIAIIGVESCVITSALHLRLICSLSAQFRHHDRLMSVKFINWKIHEWLLEARLSMYLKFCNENNSRRKKKSENILFCQSSDCRNSEQMFYYLSFRFTCAQGSSCLSHINRPLLRNKNQG